MPEYWFSLRRVLVYNDKIRSALIQEKGSEKTRILAYENPHSGKIYAMLIFGNMEKTFGTDITENTC